MALGVGKWTPIVPTLFLTAAAPVVLVSLSAGVLFLGGGGGWLILSCVYQTWLGLSLLLEKVLGHAPGSSLLYFKERLEDSSQGLR